MLGIGTVRETLERMGSDELSEWQAYESLYGLPDIYFAVGQICAAVAAPHTPKGRTPATPMDFVPYFESLRPKQTVSDMKTRFAALAASTSTARGKPECL